MNRLFGLITNFFFHVGRVKLYMSRFGNFLGLTLYVRIKMLNAGDIIWVRLPSLKHPLSVRGGSSDGKVFEHVFVDGEYEIDYEMDPTNIIDAGANVGYASIFFANKYPRAKIVAVEPEESNLSMLRENSSFYENIKIVPAGIWCKDVRLEIENPDDSQWAFRVKELCDVAGEGIAAKSVRTIMGEHGMESIDILKLDIEGAENEVLSYCDDWIGKVGCLMIELHEWIRPGTTTIFNKVMSDNNFKLISCCDHSYIYCGATE